MMKLQLLLLFSLSIIGVQAFAQQNVSETEIILASFEASHEQDAIVLHWESITEEGVTCVVQASNDLKTFEDVQSFPQVAALNTQTYTTNDDSPTFYRLKFMKDNSVVLHSNILQIDTASK